MTGAVESGAQAGMEYQERTPDSSPKQTKEVTISVLFSPFSYDLLKDYSSWKWINKYKIEYRHYKYARFITLLEWDLKGGDTNATIPVSINDVPASDKIADKKKALEQNEFDLSLFVDCSSAETCSAKIEDDDLAGYLSLTISEIKDHLFRLYKRGFSGNVNFVLAAYQPLPPLMFALIDYAGMRISECAKYDDDFILYMKQNPWFANFKSWLKKYEWKPILSDSFVYQGYLYGMSEETEGSRCSRRVSAFQAGLRKLYDFHKNVLGRDLPHGHLGWGKDDCEKWKDNGGLTRIEKGFLFDSEEPVVHVYDNDYTEEELEENRDFFIKEEKLHPDGTAEWFLDYNRDTGKGRVRNRLIQPQEKITADKLQKDFDDWKKTVYNPQREENRAVLKKIDERNTNDLEKEIWERKRVEDEMVSDTWSVDKNKIMYQGKMVDRSAFQKKIDKLDEEYKVRLETIENQQKLETLQTILTILAILQLCIGIATLGAATPAAGAILAGIDLSLEAGKIGFRHHYDKNFNMSTFFREHALGITMDLVSVLLCIPAIYKVRKLASANKLTDNPYKKLENQRPRLRNNGDGKASTPNPKNEPTQTSSVATDETMAPIKMSGNKGEIVGIASSKRKAEGFAGDSLQISSGLSNKKVAWVKIRKSDGSYVVSGIDPKKHPDRLRSLTGKDADEWNIVRSKSKKPESAPPKAEKGDRLDELKSEADASFSKPDPDHKMSFNNVTKFNYSPMIVPNKPPMKPNVKTSSGKTYSYTVTQPTKPVSNIQESVPNVPETNSVDVKTIKYHKADIEPFGEMMSHEGIPVNIAPKADVYRVLRSGDVELNNGVMKTVTTIYTGYSIFGNSYYLHLINSDGTSLEWAKREIKAKEIDGVALEDIFDSYKD